MVDVLVRLSSLINAMHAMYEKCQRKKHFLSRSITCRVAGIPSLGCGSRSQRSSSAMGLISKTLRSMSVSSVLLFLCFINDNVCTRWSDIQYSIILKNLIPYFIFYLLAALLLAR